MSRRCRVDGVIRTSVCGSSDFAGARGGCVAARALVAAVLCLGELLLMSYDWPSRRFECRALSYDVDRGAS